MHERNRDLPVTERLVPAALLLKATALAAAAVPELNGFWVDDGFRPGAGGAPRASRSRCAAAAWSRRRSTTPTSSSCAS